MRLAPRRQWLVIEPIEVEKMGTLYVPGSATAQYKRGTVVEVPSNPNEETEGLTQGDVVVYDTVGVIQFRIGNKTFHALKGREVVGVIEGSED